ncbi:hypothetical protein FACS189425_09510 [Clostridia bacterium]|nr:hypothetical protein FACS189425_09510 [Clostridia bacterium]
MRQDKLFASNRSQPARQGRKKAGRIVAIFFGILLVLFVLSFVISYNLIAAQNKPNTDALAKVEELTTINSQLMAEITDLRAQLETAQARPTPTPEASPTATPTPKPTATPTPKPTQKPTPSPTPVPVATEAPIEI